MLYRIHANADEAVDVNVWGPRGYAFTPEYETVTRDNVGWLPIGTYIGTPTSTYEQSGGRWFEEYPEFRVILKHPDTNYLQAKTAEAKSYLHAAVLAVTGRDVNDNGMAR